MDCAYRGGIDLRVLVPSPEVTRAQLEVTPDAMRKARRLVPEGAAWQGYRNGLASGMPRRADRVARAAPTAMRWALGGPVSIRGRNGVLATSGLRSSALWMLKHLGLEDSEHAWMLAGKHTPAEAKGRHRHAHWLWVSDGDKVTDLVLWVPAPNGIPEEFVPALVGIRSLARLADPRVGMYPRLCISKRWAACGTSSPRRTACLRGGLASRPCWRIGTQN